MDQLCDKLADADLASLERWDQLVRALSPAAPPQYAFQPPDDIMARVDYIHQRLGDLSATYDICLPPTLAPGWPAVFSAARVMMRPTASGGSVVIPAPIMNPSNSFGMRVQSHSYASGLLRRDEIAHGRSRPTGIKTGIDGEQLRAGECRERGDEVMLTA